MKLNLSGSFHLFFCALAGQWASPCSWVSALQGVASWLSYPFKLWPGRCSKNHFEKDGLCQTGRNFTCCSPLWATLVFMIHVWSNLAGSQVWHRLPVPAKGAIGDCVLSSNICFLKVKERRSFRDHCEHFDVDPALPSPTFCCPSTGSWIRALRSAKQVLYHWATSLALVCFLNQTGNIRHTSFCIQPFHLTFFSLNISPYHEQFFKSMFSIIVDSNGCKFLSYPTVSLL